MHVIIAQLSSCAENPDLLNEDEVFEENSDRFEYVTDRHHDDYLEDVIDVREYLSPACADGTPPDTPVPAVTISRERIKNLFAPRWEVFVETASRLRDTTLEEFSTGSSSLDAAMYGLNDTYRFDGLYILERSGRCVPVSEWLRGIQAAGMPDTQTYYIHATYDAKQ